VPLFGPTGSVWTKGTGIDEKPLLHPETASNIAARQQSNLP